MLNFFGNVTELSEQAQIHCLHVHDEVCMITETHRDEKNSLKFLDLALSKGWNGTCSPAGQSTRSDEGNIAGSITMVQSFIDNEALAICTDQRGRITPNPQLTGSQISLDKVKQMCLTGYLHGGIGFSGDNVKTLNDMDHITRGGACPFLCGIDGNTLHTEWANFTWGLQDWLEHMKAEIVIPSNSKITCKGAKNSEGGRMIDYFIVSKCLLGIITWCEVDLTVPCPPNFGLRILLNAEIAKLLFEQLCRPPKYITVPTEGGGARRGLSGQHAESRE